MRSEMDLYQMDERQRLCWLKANRGTLVVVGTCWLGAIVAELMRGKSPIFLLVMVPVFAIVRYMLYLFYKSRC